MSHERRIFISLPTGLEALVGTELALDESNIKHLKQVLRLEEAASVTAVDRNTGLELSGHLTKNNTLRISQAQNATSSGLSHNYHLIFGLSKGDKNEFIIQKATELRASSITFWQSTHSVVEIKRIEDKLPRWTKIAEEACKQSGANRLPKINFTKSINVNDFKIENSLKICCSLTTGSQSFRSIPSPCFRDIILAVGPEGGLSDQEESDLQTLGYILASLGPQRLRAETAGVSALVAAQTLWG